MSKPVTTFYWKNDELYILDQRKLPSKIVYVKCKTHLDVAKCIKKMIVRGAPAIGVVAAYGFVLGIKNVLNDTSLKDYKLFVKKVNHVVDILVSTRPTAVNLSWSVERMKNCVLTNYKENKNYILTKLLSEAKKIHKEDLDANIKMSKLGAKLIKKGAVILTHCNAGAFATSGVGTALGVIIEAHRQKKVKKVFVDETRPYLQGARITMFELMNAGVNCELITDNMAGFVIKNKRVDYIIVGADRIAKNGDTANKIGTYTLSILAKYHKTKFFVVAPSSTIDTSIKNGSQIKIEQRSSDEVKYINKKLITLKDAKAYHPAFDITPAENISAIITEKKVFKYPYKF
jgi:methylthioribose-1-phosphate isomerase